MTDLNLTNKEKMILYVALKFFEKEVGDYGKYGRSTRTPEGGLATYELSGIEVKYLAAKLYDSIEVERKSNHLNYMMKK